MGKKIHFKKIQIFFSCLYFLLQNRNKILIKNLNSKKCRKRGRRGRGLRDSNLKNCQLQIKNFPKVLEVQTSKITEKISNGSNIKPSSKKINVKKFAKKKTREIF